MFVCVAMVIYVSLAALLSQEIRGQFRTRIVEGTTLLSLETTGKISFVFFEMGDSYVQMCFM